MTEDERLRNQQYCFDVLFRNGWMNADGSMRWPSDDEGRATMARALFGMTLTNELDSYFVGWRERAEGTAAPTSETPRHGDEWTERLSDLSDDQRQLILEVLDKVLDDVAFRFAMIFDQYDFGELNIQFTAEGEDDEAGGFTVQIHPHGILDMHDEVFGWRERFGRGTDIGRSDTSYRPAPPVQPSAELAAVVGAGPLGRTEVTKRLWNYIKAHSLQEETDRSRINADDKLRKVFDGKEQVSMFEMTAFVNRHISS